MSDEYEVIDRGGGRYEVSRKLDLPSGVWGCLVALAIIGMLFQAVASYIGYIVALIGICFLAFIVISLIQRLGPKGLVIALPLVLVGFIVAELFGAYPFGFSLISSGLTLLHLQAPSAPAPAPPARVVNASPAGQAKDVAKTGVRVQPRDVGWEAQENCVACLIPNWAEPPKPGEYEWQVSYPLDKPALLRLGWCAKDKPTLDSNWSNMGYTLTIDGSAVDLKQFSQKDQVVKDSVCRFYAGALEGWPAGQHSYVWTHEIKQELNDGWDNYQPGKYVMKFEVDVR